jgi:hypothetical protein
VTTDSRDSLGTSRDLQFALCGLQSGVRPSQASSAGNSKS